MSSEIVFTPLTFPSLRERTDEAATAARTRGHSDGFISGLRAASVEADRTRLALEAENAEFARLATRRLESALSALAAATRALEQRAAPVLADAQNMLASAAVEIAEALLGHALADHESSARSALARALAHVDPALVQVVRLNPADLATLAPLDSGTLDGGTLDGGTLERGLLAAAGVKFVGDPSLECGDAVTEFTDGYLDARISTALGRVRTALLGAS